MRKIIAAFNITLDGISDHTAGIPDADLHRYYTRLLNDAGLIVYGRITYKLMQYWQGMLNDPSGNKAMDKFAHAINNIPKIVFSTTLHETGWATATMADAPLQQQIEQLKQQPDKDVLIGSKSLIIQLLNSGLIDEFRLCIHPVIAAGGDRLFDDISRRIRLKMKETRVLNSGAVILHYQPLYNS